MIRFKKTIGILLSVLLVFGCVTTAFAAPTAYEKGTATLKLEAPAGSIANGANGTVAVKVTTDFLVANMSLPVFYKETAGVTVTAAAEAGFNVTTEAEAVNKTAVYTGAGLNADGTDSQGAKYNFFLITFIGKVGAQAEQFADKLACNITVTNAGDFKGALEFKTFAASKKTVENTTGLLFIGKSTSATIEHAKPVDCADGLVATGTVNFGSAVAKFQAKQGTTGYIDEARKYIYGVEAGKAITDYFEMSDGSPLNIENGTASVPNGTGATVTLADGTVYTLIIFGDVNGDGMVTQIDSGAINAAVIKVGTLLDIQAFAADVNADDQVTQVDSGAVDSAVIKLGVIPVNPYAKV